MPEKEKSELQRAAEAAGGVVDPFDGIPSIQDRLGDEKIHFHEDQPRMDWESLVNREFVILDAFLVPEWESRDIEGGESRFALLFLRADDGKEYTTLAGGGVIYKRVEKLLKTKSIPVKVKLIMQPGTQGGRPYYQFR